MDKQYKVNWRNDEIVSIMVNGVEYDSLDQIPDPDDRAAVEQLVNKKVIQELDAAFGEGFEKEFEDLERMSVRLPKIVSGIFFAVGTLLLIIAIVLGLNTNRRLANEIETTGRVLETVTRPNEEGTLFHYPIVEFFLENEQRQTFTSTLGRTTPQYSSGDTVTVRYDPADPTSARISENDIPLLMWLGTAITGCVSLIVLGAGLLVFWFLRPSSSEEMSQRLEKGFFNP